MLKESSGYYRISSDGEDDASFDGNMKPRFLMGVTISFAVCLVVVPCYHTGFWIRPGQTVAGKIESGKQIALASMPATTSFTKIDAAPDKLHGKPIARSSHGLSIVNGGRHLVLYGGEHVARTPVEPEQALWVVNVPDNQWQRIMPEHGPPPRIAHAQATVDDKFVYIFGGRAGVSMEEAAMNDLWKLDTSSFTWTKVEPSGNGSPPPEERSFHRMVSVGRSLYVFGGCGAKDGRLADLHRFDVDTSTWHNLGTSLLRGRGGANLFPVNNGAHLAIVAGFAGEETADGQLFNLATQKWEPAPLTELEGLRPRSVCVSGSFPSKGICAVFGGEVDPSGKGHEGAGDFANDLALFDCKTAKYLGNVPPAPSDWPEPRGWSDAAVQDNGNTEGHMYIFGGLSGDDANPIRRDDLWRLDVR